jgi:adenosine deaminase
VFARARREGYLLTMHCDVNQQDSVSHIWDCVNLIGVDRIDHGVNCLEDSTLCQTLADRKLALTVCPISNTFVTDGPATDAVAKMLDLGLRVTINSDDPAYFGGYIEENFALVEERLKLGPAGLSRLSKNAIEAAWLPRATKDLHLAKVEAHLAAFA